MSYNEMVEHFNQGIQEYGDGGKVQPYQAKNQQDFEYRQKMYNDSLSAYNFGEGITKHFASKIKEIKDKNIPIEYWKSNLKTPAPGTNILPYTAGGADWKSEDQSKKAHNVFGIQFGENTTMMDGVKYARWKKPTEQILPPKQNLVNQGLSLATSIKKQSTKSTKPSYQEFLKTVNPDYLGPDYNLEEAYKNLPYNVTSAWAKNPEKNHLPDTYKLPNHPTFSNESIYYKPGMKAGRWEGENYIPIPTTPKQAVGRLETTQLPTDNPRYGMIIDYSGKWIPAEQRQKQYGVSDAVMKFNNLPTKK
jgi:hypothetical protein